MIKHKSYIEGKLHEWDDYTWQLRNLKFGSYKYQNLLNQ